MSSANSVTAARQLIHNYTSAAREIDRLTDAAIDIHLNNNQFGNVTGSTTPFTIRGLSRKDSVTSFEIASAYERGQIDGPLKRLTNIVARRHGLIPTMLTAVRDELNDSM